MKYYSGVSKLDELKAKRKTVIYVRESSKWQANEGYNIHVQEMRCKDYIKAVCDDVKDIENVEVYREKGYSAKTIKRPVLDELLNEIKNGKIKCVVVQKLDRLARRNLGMCELLTLFEEYDVRLIALRECIDTNSCFFKTAITLNTLIAEIEQDVISERTNEALEYAAEIGSYIKGGNPPFGTVKERIYREDGKHLNILKPHPLYWSVLLKIYDLSYHGKTCVTIATLINSMPIMVENDKHLSEDTVEKILTNKIYCGIQKHKDKEYKVNFDGCLSEDYWKQVQINRSIHLKRDTKIDYQYHGKVHCECGAICVVDVSKKKLADGSIKRYKYYVCPVCGKRVSEAVVHDNAESRIEKYFNMHMSEQFCVEQKKKLKKIESMNDMICDMYTNDKISLKELEKRLTKSQGLKERIEKNLGKKAKKYNELSVIERKEFIDENIKSIVLCANKNVRVNYVA